MADMTFKMEISAEDLWHYILCLEDRVQKGNNNPAMSDFLFRELERLNDIHDKWAQFQKLEDQGVEITSVSV